MLERLELQDAGPAPSMHLDFGSRLNLFTGDNGLGKTFVLDVVWFVLTGTWAGYPAAPRREPGAKPEIVCVKRRAEAIHKEAIHKIAASFNFEDQSWDTDDLSEAHVEESALVFYARVDGSFSIWDPFRKVGY